MSVRESRRALIHHEQQSGSNSQNTPIDRTFQKVYTAINMEHRALPPILPLPVTPSQFNLHYRGPTLNYFAGFDSKT